MGAVVVVVDVVVAKRVVIMGASVTADGGACQPEGDGNGSLSHLVLCRASRGRMRSYAASERFSSRAARRSGASQYQVRTLRPCSRSSG